MATGMHLGVVSSPGVMSNLVLDCRNSSKWRGAAAILFDAHGTANQSVSRDDMGRIVPQHAPGLCLDVKGGDFKEKAVLNFWVIKTPAASNQRFVLDSSGYLTSTGDRGGELVVGSQELGSGARLCMVRRDDPGAIQFEWRVQPPQTHALPRPTPPPPPAKKEEGPSSSDDCDKPAPENASSSTSSGCGGNGSSSRSTSGGGACALPDALVAALSADNYFEALGLSEARELDDSTVRRAYLKASVKVHPDKHPGNGGAATVAFQRISEAYAGLKDPSERRRYGADLRDKREGCRGFGPVHPDGTSVHTASSSSSSSSSAASSSGGGDGGGQRRGGEGGGGGGGGGVSFAQAAAFFAAAFAAETAAGNLAMPTKMRHMAGAAVDVAELSAALKAADSLLSPESGGSTGQKLAAGLMVAQSAARLGGTVERLGLAGGKLGQLGGALGSAVRVGTTVAALGSIAVAAANQLQQYDGDEGDGEGDGERREKGRRGGGGSSQAAAGKRQSTQQYHPPESDF